MQWFPAKLTAPDGRVHDPVKAYQSGGRVDVYGIDEERGRGVVLLVSLPGTLQRLGSGQRFETDGRVWVLGPARGCGCGHPLKRFRPPVAQPA